MRLGPIMVLTSNDKKIIEQTKETVIHQGYLPVSVGKVTASIRKQFPNATGILYTVFYVNESWEDKKN